ncbi:MAG: GxxExxY protein [Acidobacteria bacterium]|nr:MAG: GxxExxY protein [Acidobacteriota bacterium]
MNHLAEQIIGCALDVHCELGPGILESAYEACLTLVLLEHGLKVERQKVLPLTFRDQILDCGYRIDLMVEDSVIVEVKSVEKLERVHRSQLLSYLRLSDRKLGLLMNFNVRLLKEGIKRVVNGFPE